jgi:hypothetical protein
MDAVSLLVKTTAPVTQTALGLGVARPVVAKPLMPHIAATARSGGRLGASANTAAWYQVTVPDWKGSVWDACHAIANRSPGAGIAADAVQFVEPDLQQQWPYVTSQERGLRLTADSSLRPNPQNKDYPNIPDQDDWYRDDDHAQFRAALAALGTNLPTVRVAHLDTGYDPAHNALPQAPRLRVDLARNFVDDPPTNSAADTTSGILNNLGHGTGTMSILAGVDPADRTRAIGAAPFVEVVPIRVANRVVLFSNSAIAKALDAANLTLPDYARARAWVRAAEPFGAANGLATANGRLRRDAIFAAYAERIGAHYSHEPATVA